MHSPSEKKFQVKLPEPPRAARLVGFQPGIAPKPATNAAPKKHAQWELGYAEGKAAIQPAEAALRKSVAELQRRFEAEIKALEPQIVDLALAIAKSVLGKEIEKGNYDLPAIVAGIVSSLRGEPGPITVKLNPADHAALAQNPATTGSEMQFVPDPKIPRASCAVSTGYGTIVREVDALLAEVERALGKTPSQGAAKP